MVGLISAAGVLGYLSEPDTDLQVFALETLNEQIDSVWTEAANSITTIEALHEDESFPERSLAALVAAKVYYNLQEYEESMTFALGAGNLFDIDKAGEFEDTVISQCIDAYILQSAATHKSGLTRASSMNGTGEQPVDYLNGHTSTTSVPTTPFSQTPLQSKSLLSRDEEEHLMESVTQNGSAKPNGILSRNINKALTNIVERLFEKCYQQGRYKEVIGIAVEARNLDKIRETILRARDDEGKGKKAVTTGHRGEELMEYVLDICMDIVQERELREKILMLILDLLNEMPSPEYFSITKCIVYLNRPKMAAKVLKSLIEKDEGRSLAIAYQLCFDMYGNSSQDFLLRVLENLDEKKTSPAGDNSNKSEESQQLLQELNQAASTQPAANTGEGTASSASPNKVMDSIKSILRGTKTIELNLEFLYRNNKSDMAILTKVKDSLEARNSIFHTAVTLCNAFMNAGTLNDKFIRDNLDWLGRASNWSQFTASAALGVIHKGNLSQGQKLLQPYLPSAPGAGQGSTVYSQGGSLYALGLIYANHEQGALDQIRRYFGQSSEEVVIHGAALGLGVAGMATGDQDIFDELKEKLYEDSALYGEAVGTAMGLIMLGTGSKNSNWREMLEYAHETQHEKIVRGLSLGIALTQYDQQEAADELYNRLLEDTDPLIRFGGVQTLALAYCGTGSNKAVRKLLHIAISDVNDDVRRVAVMSLGFILFRKPSSVPRMVELLAESYNPHVRYGAAMALGIACAGTGFEDAIDLLEPMMKDPTDFVRQGVLIALSMILMQTNEVMNPKVTTVRKALIKTVGDKHEDAMTKFGAAISLGILEAGGKNCTISLQTQTGNLNMSGIVGMMVFTQYWYWFPLTHFLSLSFTPTAIIAVDQDLEIPDLKFHSNTRPSLFGYPPEEELKTEDAPEKIKTAILSTTLQAKRRAQRKEKQQKSDAMEVDQPPATPKTVSADDKMETGETTKSEEASKSQGETSGSQESDATKKAATEPAKKKLEREKVGYEIENMSRVLPAQFKYISSNSQRYELIKKPTSGVVLMTDKSPSEAKSLLELKARKKVRTQAIPSTGTTLRDIYNNGMSDTTQEVPVTPVRGAVSSGETQSSGQAAAVLTAIDEDSEGGEAEVPKEFVYETDEDAE